MFIDFDSTFNQVEALDSLIEITIHDQEQREMVMAEIERITDLGMSGKINYMQSLRERFNLLSADRDDVSKLAQKLYKSISPSFVAHQRFFIENKNNISIISNGFKDFIIPVITKFGLLSSQVYANTFVYDENNNIIGLDTANPLAQEAGKPKVIKKLQLNQKIIMLGDGYNDYQVKKEGACETFILYTENIRREDLVKYADVIASNFDDVLNFIFNE